jgi:hypothetical protein
MYLVIYLSGLFADLAKMASIQEQLKQIRAASDDWYDEHRR